MSQEWAIDFDYGLQQLNNFVFESSHTDRIDFAARREAKFPTIISADGTLISRDKDFKNAVAGSILHLKLSGTMRSEDGLCSRGINSLINDMYDGFSAKNIDGIFMEVDTGGGESSAGHKLHNAMLDKNKPILTYGHRIASAGIMGTLASDEIVALFQSEVAKFRNLSGSDEYKEKTLSGGMFYANEAKNRGLVDYIGTKNDALRRLRSHINFSKK